MQRLGDYTQELRSKQTLRTTTRIFQSLFHGDGLPPGAAAYARTRRTWADRDEINRVLMAATTGMTQSSDGSLVGVRVNDLFAYVRARDIIGRLLVLGSRSVGFDAALTAMTGGTSASWVGEGKPAPFSKPAFSRLATPLGVLKIVAMCAEGTELLRAADPDSELIIGADFADACVAAADGAFIDPQNAGIAGVKPASIVFGAPAFASSGVTAAQIDADLGRLIESLVANGSNLLFAVWILHPLTAAAMARINNAAGDRAYPALSVKGGELLGLPAITSASVPHVGSPQSGSIVLLDASRVWVAEDPAMELALSKAAAVQFVDNPTNDITTPTPTAMVSAFQTHSVILRGTRTVNWQIATPGACAVLNGVAL
jgi:HK97 family phage major capsid protein